MAAATLLKNSGKAKGRPLPCLEILLCVGGDFPTREAPLVYIYIYIYILSIIWRETYDYSITQPIGRAGPSWVYQRVCLRGPESRNTKEMDFRDLTFRFSFF